jgi:phage terminase large subunit-like protein
MGRRPDRTAAAERDQLDWSAAWDTSCADWEDRLLSGQPLVPSLPLFRQEAAKGLRCFKRLRLPDVNHTPTLGDTGAPWIFDIVEAIFGAYDPVLNKRHIQEFFLLVPKKNGKSSYAAGIMVTAIICNIARRPNAEFNFLAPTIEVAGISFRQARGIIKLDEQLNKLFHIQDNIRRITHRNSDSFLQIKAADQDIVTGGKPLGTLIDETHLFADKSHAADLFVEMRGALASRPDGFLIQITTQSKKPPAGVFKAELARARDVRDGKLKLPKPLLPILYELPRKISTEWEDEKYWSMVNPNLGRSVDPDFLRSTLIDSRRKGQGELALFASQHFNVEIGQALRHDGWAGAEFWEKQTDPSLTLESLLQRAEVTVVGIDGGGLDDLFGLCVLGRCKQTKHWLVWSHAWCHEGVLQRRQTIAASLLDFEANGELTIVQDNLDDISAIIEIIADIKRRNLLACVAVDPAGISEFVEALGGIGISVAAKNLLGAPQGYAMMNTIKGMERRLANGTLWHSKSALMTWAVGNVKIEPMATAIRATKQNAGDLKIDPVMAMFDAGFIMGTNPSAAPIYSMSFM